MNLAMSYYNKRRGEYLPTEDIKEADTVTVFDCESLSDKQHQKLLELGFLSSKLGQTKKGKPYVQYTKRPVLDLDTLLGL